MNPDFDLRHRREGTACAKWDGRREVFGTEDVLPLWVADMDFAAPEAVMEALRSRVDHGIFGYPLRAQGAHNAFAAWMARRHGWAVDPDWILEAPGVVPLLALAVQTFTAPGDGVVIQPPVYPPFRSVVERQGREVVENPLRWDGKRYVMDLEDLERRITPATRLLILSSPHNPVGRVWERQELESLGALCLRHGILVLSDEIHQDLLFSPHHHTPFASLGDDVARIALTFTSPGKTFNIPGLRSGMAVIQDETVRRRMKSTLEALDLEMWNVLGIAATEAAYTAGGPWLDALMTYLDGHRRLIQEELARTVPEVGYSLPEGTYLAWLDFRPLLLCGEELRTFLVHRAHLGLNDGRSFGPGGEGFARLNFACPRTTLMEALRRLAEARSSL
ncbi:MAG: Cystathionine beta-lyase PatB [Synergistetes bacterium ADurb.Bin520]|nr:MAG: Cystathionine beta-lyase PatB [Synergistetes bacterium ADurb.Bin520]